MLRALVLTLCLCAASTPRTTDASDAAPTMGAPEVAGSAAAASASMPTSASPPLEAYGRLPSLDAITLSPDGTRYAFVTTGTSGAFLVMQSLADGTPLHVLRLNDVKLRHLQWADDDHLLVLSSVTAHVMDLSGPKREWSMLQVCAPAKKTCRPLDFGVAGRETMNVVFGVPEVRRVGDRTLVYAMGVHVTDRTLPALFAFDVAGTRARLVAPGTADTRGWLVDAAGAVAVEERYSEKERRWSLHARRADGALHEIAVRPASIETPDPLGFAADGRSIVVEFVENGDPVWRVLSIDDGSWSELPVAGLAFGRPILDRLTQRLAGAVFDRDGRTRFVDPERQRRWDALVRAHGSTSVRFVSASDTFDRVLLLAFGGEVAPEYRLLDWARRRADPIGAVYGGVKVTHEIRTLEYAAADGFRVPAILALPRGREPKRLPLIVLPHGGPASYDTPEFDWWAQALASRGYAVLQPNYRGSALNWAHLSAGFGEWGRKMQTDLSDGVAHLAAQGTVDAGRVCIAGGSYAGYAALAGVALQSGHYRCAASIGGLSDPAKFLRWVERTQNADRRPLRYWERFLGARDPDDPVLREISPLAHADAVTVPVLLIHGRDDTVVPFEQSAAMADALRRRRKQVDLVLLKHEDHWLSRSDTRLQMLTALVAFLEKHNPP